jgi:hypothetical protein
MMLRVVAAAGLAVVAIASNREHGTPSELAPQTGRAYYVSPDGRASADGTRDRPWDLATAMAGAGGRVQPGDTVWLRAGRYVGDDFTTHLRGTAGARITFRQFPGERATIDGRLLARGAYLDFWGFEITQSNPLAKPEQQLLDGRTDYGRYINLVLHDANTHGVNFWTPGVDAELYGCIIYNNGTHENLDHGVYVHNEAGTKRLADNVFFNNYARGIQVYASRRNPHLRNVHAEGNISFNNGTISMASTRVNLLFNAQAPVEGMSAVDNLLFFSPGVGGINIRAGREAQPYRGLVLRKNYLVGGKIGIEMGREWQAAIVDSNTIVGLAGTTLVRTVGAASSYRWTANRYVADPASKAWNHGDRRLRFTAWRSESGLGATDRAGEPLPAQPVVFVRPNKYERGRAHIAVVNFPTRTSVQVDLTGMLGPGDRYEIRNVQDLWGPPVVSGTFAGAAITIPMAGVEPPAPVGRTTPSRAPRTAPLFDVFLLTRAPDEQRARD